MQDQQDIVTTDLDSGLSRQTEHMTGKPDEAYEIVVGIAIDASSVGTLLKHVRSVVFADEIVTLEYLGPPIMGARPFA